MLLSRRAWGPGEGKGAALIVSARRDVERRWLFHVKHSADRRRHSVSRETSASFADAEASKHAVQHILRINPPADPRQIARRQPNILRGQLHIDASGQDVARALQMA